MKILHIDNLMIRRYGQTKVATGRKLFNGMIRNNWKVLEFSERDIAKFEAPLGIKPLGLKNANRRLVETADNFRPDVVLMGHCNIIRNETLQEIRRMLPAVKILYRNVDALWQTQNVERIRHRMETADAIFISTGGEALKQFCTGKNVVAFIPNPTDPCVEDQDNSLKTKFDRDLIFCGVGNETDNRYPFVGELHRALRGTLRFDSFGMHGKPALWGCEYDEALALSKMGLNLNRFEDWPLYSSARISQLMGNGLLTFLWDKGNLRKFFTDEQAAFFKDFDELVAKAKKFQADDSLRQAVAGAGRAFYHEHFSGQRVIQFMIETTMGIPYSHDYIWQDEVYR
jgi:hypothetical protein